MEVQFNFIKDVAKQYEQFTKDYDLLYKAINELSDKTLENIFMDYANSQKFQPVNVVRFEVARLLINGEATSRLIP